MIVVDLPDNWDDLAAAYMAQSVALAGAQKVADAAVAWFACEYDGDEEATTYAALLRAVNEYCREYRARAEANGKENKANDS